MRSAAPTNAADDAVDSRARQDARLAADVDCVLRLRDEIVLTAQGFDPARVLGLVAAGGGAEQYLACTIPRIARQIEATGRRTDLVIGLNNGFSCASTIAHLKALDGMEVIELATGDKPGPAIPALCFERAGDPARPYTIPAANQGQHRIFVVHQHQGPHAAGKIRMLDDLGRGLILPSIQAGWQPPQYTLAFDAETLFLAQAEDRILDRELAQMRALLARMAGSVDRVVSALIDAYHTARQRQAAAPPAPAQLPNIESNGLAPLLERLDSRPDLHIVGAITRFCAYDSAQTIADLSVRLPDFAAPCSAMHAIYNYTCGIVPGCMCMPGGGTIGRTECMISLLATISRLYPGTTSEDAILTVLAEPAGFRIELCDRAVMTNRCPRPDEWTSHQPPRLAWQQQFARWYAGFDAVERHYGRHNTAAVLGPSPDDFLAASLAVFWKTLRQTGNIPGSLALLQQVASCGSAYEEIRAMAVSTPDNLTGPNGRPAW